jgi:hypothetical protein
LAEINFIIDVNREKSDFKTEMIFRSFDIPNYINLISTFKTLRKRKNHMKQLFGGEEADN